MSAAKGRQYPKLAYSVAEAVQVTSLSRANLYNLIAAGKLDARKVGRRTLIPAAALERLIGDAS